ncbi:MAG: glycosyltransferase family 2 protein [Deltaproteobacteria bacterium]|nr:glycosyltransferase family 2 protein [Deltaproteobacteria bacterium]
MERLDSITAFFPAFNDGGTIASMVISALITLPKVTNDFEVIVINDGSKDYTGEILDELARIYPEVKIINHGTNKGYGSALRSGFGSSSKSWIFYTDGDAQYDPRELVKLVRAVSPDTDIVNGYKISRSDPLHRILIGRLYHHIVRVLFGFKLKDVDCDFRLISREVLEKVQLDSTSGTICLEMVKKFQDAGFRFKEVGVHHFHRAYGKSQFFNFRRLLRTGVQLLSLWWDLVLKKRIFRLRSQEGTLRP